MKELVRRLLREGRFTQAEAYQRFGYVCAGILLASGLLLRLSDSSEERRVRVVLLGALGYAGVIAAAMIQTYGGKSPFDVGVASTAAQERR